METQDRLKWFILQRIPFFVYEKYYEAFFKGNSDTPLSVWVNTFINDWKVFQQKKREEGELAEKVDDFCEMLKKFSMSFNEVYEMNSPETLRRADWLRIVEYAKHIYE
jgi:hypothetical protein